MNTTLQELLHAINILGEDRDVTVAGINTIAVCPPVKLTPAGKKHFKHALAANVEVEYRCDCYYGAYVSDEGEIAMNAWDLISSLAGFCGTDHYAKWFEGEEAEII